MGCSRFCLYLAMVRNLPRWPNYNSAPEAVFSIGNRCNLPCARLGPIKIWTVGYLLAILGNSLYLCIFFCANLLLFLTIRAKKLILVGYTGAEICANWVTLIKYGSISRVFISASYHRTSQVMTLQAKTSFCRFCIVKRVQATCMWGVQYMYLD